MSEAPRTPFEDLTDDEAIARLWRSGRISAAIGASVALGVCALVGVGLIALFSLLPRLGGSHPTADDLVPLIVRAAGLIVLGAAIGLMITSLGFTSRLTAVLGRDVLTRRIRRAVFRNDTTPLTPDEQARAARYAHVGGASHRFQVVSLGTLYLGLLLQQVPQLFQEPAASGFDLRPLALVTVILLLALYAVLLPLQIRYVVRARRYAATHRHPGGRS